MDDLQKLLEFVVRAEIRAKIEERVRDHELRLQQASAPGVIRTPLCELPGLAWGVSGLRSLWLLSHPGYRRAGFRKHPDSLAVLLAWRGEGLVLCRPAGKRQSFQLVPWTTPLNSSRHYVEVPAETLYDTLAEVGFWHLLVFQTQTSEQLVRLQETPDGLVELPENDGLSGPSD